MSGYLTTLGGKHLPLHDGFVIGRVAGCDLVIDDSKASRRHARIVVEAGVAEVEDLGSSNGTRLNDKPVTRRVLRDGDRIQIGATVLVYREGAAPGAAAVRAAASPFDDDDDLLGGAPTSPGLAPPPAPPPPTPPPPPPPARTPLPPAAPPPAAKPAANVVEFADEVVEVRKPAAAPAAKPAAASAPGPAPSTSGRILQFQKQAGGGGLLGDDLGQVGGGMRAALVLGALALGAGIVWLTIQLVG